MDASRLHVVLAHSRESKIALIDDGQRRPIGSMDSMEFLTIQRDGLDIGNILKPEPAQIMDRKVFFHTFQLAEHKEPFITQFAN